MTVSDLREKLKDLPDDMPVAVERAGIRGNCSSYVETLCPHGDESYTEYHHEVPKWSVSKGPKAPVLVIRG